MSGAVPATADHREALWGLLRELDASGESQFPAGFDRTATRERFGALVARTDAEFGCSSLDEQDVQSGSDGVQGVTRRATSAS
ncbi:hypothetical protein ACIBTP_19065 [Streptomyces avidinii]|uniref:hypothetical protein n=1 Tax=Streptomyces avidinii TaxID=1895 RepID=UPI0037AE4739